MEVTKMHMAMIALLFISMAFAFSVNMSTVAASPYDIYVNTAGNDTWDGQYATWNGTSGPKATIKNATGTVAANGTVHIANGTYNENGINVYMKSVNFVGESRDSTIINGTNTGRIFNVGQAGGGQFYTFTNLTFVNGNAVGGAIWNYGTTTITNCVFKNNTGPYSGGAIYSQGQGSFYAPLTITNSYFIGNKVTSGSGGAIYGGSSNIVITNCDFVNNTAVTSGSAAYGISAIHFSRIIGTGNSLIAGSSTDASLNWWGSNADPTSKVQSGVKVGPWLVLTAPSNISLTNGGSSIVMADLQHDSNGAYHNPISGHVPDGITTTYAGDSLGTVNPLNGATINGLLMTTFTAGATNGVSHPTFTVDSQSVTGNVTIAGVTGTNMAVNPVSGHYNDVVNLIATLKNTGNNPLSGKTVNFYVNGSSAGSATTNASGAATLSYTIAQGTGIYQILAQFLGDATYSGSTGTNNLNVNPITTNIIVNNPSSGYYGDLVNIVATLTDTNNVPISGAKVYFSANGTPLGTATTNGLGVATLPWTISTGAGDYQILAQFMGDTAYNGSSATGSITVSPTPTSTTVTPVTVNYNTYTYLTATLKDTIHNVAISRPLNFYVNGTLMGTSAGSLYINVGLNPGTYTFFVQFAGDTGYLASNGTSTLTVNYVPTSLTVVPKTGNYGDTVSLNATLKNAQTSAGLSGKTVDFYVNGNLVGSATTNASGIAILPYTIKVPSGSYPIFAQFAGDAIYNTTNATSTLTVSTTSTNIVVDPVSTYHNDVVNLSATLKDSLHNVPLAGQQVNFTVNGVSAGSAITDASGVATLSYTVTQGIGSYQIFAQFAGDNAYNATNATSTLNVNATPTTTVVNPVSGYYGDVVNLIGTLTDTHNNVPVSGAAINFTVNGTSIGTATTNASGVATLPYTITLTTGTYSILAQFVGDTIYGISNATNNLIVNHIPTMLVLNPVSGNYGDPVTLTATLTDLHNNVIVSGKTVYFILNGNSIGSAITDASGIATLPYSIYSGTYLVQFLGDSIYSSSTGAIIPSVVIPTQLVVDAVNGLHGDTVNLIATLTDTTHNLPVSGKTVSFTVNGNSLGSAVTNTSGVATLPYTIALTQGVYQILAQFAGDTAYAATSNTNDLTVLDNTAPTVTNVDPANNSVNVPVTTTIKVTFSESIKLGKSAIGVKNLSTGQYVPLTATVNGNILTITFSNNLTPGTQYLLMLSPNITDLAGNPLSAYSSKFTTDGTAPTVTSVDPANNSVNVPVTTTIKVTFSESIKLGSSAIGVKDLSTGQYVPLTASVSGNTLTITFKNSLTSGTQYLLMLSPSITDLAGNPIKSYSSKFTTA